MSLNTPAFITAFTESMAAGLNPMNGVVRQYAEQTTERGNLEIEGLRAELIETIEGKLNAAKARNAPAAVQSAFERQLARVSK